VAAENRAWRLHEEGLMHRKHLIVTATAAVLAATGGVAYAASSTPNITTPQTIRLVAHQTPVSFVRVPGQTSQQPVSGDQIIFGERVTRGGVTVGHNLVHCTVVRHALICDAVFSLHDGTISANGRVPVNGPGRSGTRIAVTGGTGRYQNVRGEVHVFSTGRSTETEVLHLLP
jgi:hypothetical protein